MTSRRVAIMMLLVVVRRGREVVAPAPDLQLLLVVGHHEAEEGHEDHEP